MKKAGIIIFFILLFLLAVSALLLLRCFPELIFEPTPTPEPEPVVAHVVEEGQSVYRICADAKDLAAVASAEYLARLFPERMGVELPVDTDGSGEEGSRIVFRSEPAGEDGLPFEIILEENADIVFCLRADEENYGCARALADRWLSEGCGLRENALFLDQELIDTGFSDLSFDLTGVLRILDQNICYTDDPDGNSVAERTPRFFQLVEQYAPDVITMQEISAEWNDILREKYSEDYEIVGCLAYGWDSIIGIGNYILLSKDRFLYLNGGVMWLSETPEVERSRVIEDCGPRTCAWALMKDQETGQVFYVVTTHPAAGNEGIDKMIRSMQIKYCLDNTDLLYESYGEYPMFLTGDFNIKMANEPDLYLSILERFTNASTTALYNGSEVNYTWHNYGTRSLLLDYCFYRGDDVLILNQHIATDMYDGYVSDHYALVTDVYFD